MLKKIWILAAILLVGLASFNLLNKPTEEDNAVAYQEDPSIAILREKLHEKYVGVDVKTTAEKELVLQVVANEAYFDSVKKDMEAITKSVIQTSALKDYTVVFKRWDNIRKINSSIDKDLHHLIDALMGGLEKYEVFESIITENASTITIQTSIKGSDKDAQKLAMEIEKTVNEILQSKDVAYEIKILNTKGKAVN